ncbi:MAG: hypothetical protein Q8927_10250 [Bacteroidota bacterium]|nr:hypothetical protein [Bacteroidota bacterium]MDP4216573.1 hypothetical protein [Bacteroidota bacterium]MDP4245037.1 hypothetical protein [Bacteroidota bacterium]MDP4254763.1 hypothetical protein [Bacteroidota bacterium]MDP4259864.1 hypothetical protein [Bacteroidota bacterium]
MAIIKCKIGNREYRLDYEKVKITSGVLYHGTVFQNHIFEFFFVVFTNGDPILFSPLHADEERKRVVIKAIEEHEKGLLTRSN